MLPLIQAYSLVTSAHKGRKGKQQKACGKRVISMRNDLATTKHKSVKITITVTEVSAQNALSSPFAPLLKTRGSTEHRSDWMLLHPHARVIEDSSHRLTRFDKENTYQSENMFPNTSAKAENNY